MATRNLIPAIAAAVLAACAVGPDYRKPELSLPERLEGTAEAGVRTVDDASLATFWTQFGDPALDQLVQSAMFANHDLRIALARLNEARALRGAARLDLGPSVMVNAAYSDRRLAAAEARGGPRDVDGYDAGFDATW